jgi:hypothetical protein
MEIIGLSVGWYRDRLEEWDDHPQSEVIWEDLAEQTELNHIETIEDFIGFMEN